MVVDIAALRVVLIKEVLHQVLAFEVLLFGHQLLERLPGRGRRREQHVDRKAHEPRRGGGRPRRQHVGLSVGQAVPRGRPILEIVGHRAICNV